VKSIFNNKKGNYIESKEQDIQIEGLNVYQHILSSGKDGCLLVQDLRNGTFPRQHIARAVVSISSKGHVAYQRGEVSRADQVRHVMIIYYISRSFVSFRRAISVGNACNIGHLEQIL
jgi:hypothetical protein